MTDSASQAPSLLLVPVSDERSKRRGRGQRRRWLSRLVVMAMILVGLVATGGIGASAAPPAQAVSFIDMCSDLENLSARTYSWPGGTGVGTSALMPTGNVVGLGLNAITNSTTSAANPYTQGMYTEYDDYTRTTLPNGDVATVGATTAYEWWGLAGLEWVGFNVRELEPAADCGWTGLGWTAMTSLSNFFWQMAMLIGNIVLLLYTLTTTPAVMNTMLAPLGALLQNMGASLFLPFLVPMVIVAALWVAWTGLVKSRGTEAFQGVVWVLAAAISASVFFLYPLWFVERMNGAIGVVQSAVLEVVAGAGQAAGVTSANETSLCYAGDPGNVMQQGTTGTPAAAGGLSQAAQDARNINTRQMQCLMWQIFMFVPWKEGQFGPLADVVMDDPNVPDATINGRAIDAGDTLALKYLNAVVVNHDEIVNDATGAPGTEAQWADKQQDVKDIVAWMATNYTQPVADKTKPRTDVGFSGVWNFVGGNGSNQIGMALLGLVAILFGGIPLIFLSTKLLFYELMTVIMLLLSPLYLTLGIHPGFGRRTALGWLEYIVNLSIKRIGVMFLLSVLLLVIQIVMIT